MNLTEDIVKQVAARVKEILAPHNIRKDFVRGATQGALGFVESHNGFLITVHTEGTMKTIEVFALHDKQK